MASTSLTLSPHWEDFIAAEVRSGRYASASEVMRAGLRELEDKRRRLAMLQTHLAEGADQAARGEFIDGFDIDDVITEALSNA
jgi:antitoxin ParD1/3/4